MTNSRRISLIVGLAILGGGTTARAQAQPGIGTAGRSGPAASAAPATIAPPSATDLARVRPRAANPSFNRVTTMRRSPGPSARGSIAAGGGPVASGSMGQDDPLRPYSARVREADAQAAMGSTRTQPRAVSPPPMARSSHSYYPGMRVGQHPNANVPHVRPHCVPTRGGVMAGGVGRGRSMAGGVGRGR